MTTASMGEISICHGVDLTWIKFCSGGYGPDACHKLQLVIQLLESLEHSWITVTDKIPAW